MRLTSQKTNEVSHATQTHIPDFDDDDEVFEKTRRLERTNECDGAIMQKNLQLTGRYIHSHSI